MGKETSDFQCRRAAKERRVLEAKLRLGVRPDYPDTPEQIAEGKRRVAEFLAQKKN